MKLSTPNSSVDGAIIKTRSLSRDLRWNCLFAADDMTRFESVWKRIVAALWIYEHPTLENVEEAVTSAYQCEFKQMAENALAPLTMDLTTFVKEGRARLGDDLFKEWHAAILAIDPHVELMVFGFDNSGSPHLFTTSTFGEIASSPLGFDAIGSGGSVARSFLHGNPDFRHSSDIGLIAYRLCEAKFEAEGAQGVGTETFVMTFASEGFPAMLRGGLNSARALWKKRRESRVPERVLSGLRGWLTHDAIPLEIVKVRYVQLSLEYERAVKKVVGLRARGLLGDDQWKRFYEAQIEIREANSIVFANLNTWQGSDEKPADFDVAFERLASAQTRPAQILKESAKP